MPALLADDAAAVALFAADAEDAAASEADPVAKFTTESISVLDSLKPSPVSLIHNARPFVPVVPTASGSCKLNDPGVNGLRIIALLTRSLISWIINISLSSPCSIEEEGRSTCSPIGISCER